MMVKHHNMQTVKNCRQLQRWKATPFLPLQSVQSSESICWIRTAASTIPAVVEIPRNCCSSDSSTRSGRTAYCLGIAALGKRTSAVLQKLSMITVAHNFVWTLWDIYKHYPIPQSCVLNVLFFEQLLTFFHYNRMQTLRQTEFIPV